MTVTTAPPRPGAPPGVPPARRSWATRAVAGLAVAAALVALIVFPPGGRELPPGVVARVVAGAVELDTASGWQLVRVGAEIPFGARVRVASETARLGVRDGAVELASGGTVVLDADRFDLERGSLLLETTRTRAAGLGAVAAEGEGTWRLDADVAPRVGVYRGGVGVTVRNGNGQPATPVAVAAYEQLDIVRGLPASRPLPLRYLPSDVWDARFLEDAIAVDRQVADLRRSLAAAYGTAPRPLAFYTAFSAVEGPVVAVLGDLAPQQGGAALGPPADVLIAVVVVQLLVDRAGLEPADAAGEVVGLRRDGATWGLVLLRRDLGPDDLREGVDVALRRRALEGGGNGGAPAPDAPGGGGAPEPEPTAQPSPEPSPSPPTPPPSPPPPPRDSLLGPILRPLAPVIQDLTDLLDGLLPPDASEADGGERGGGLLGGLLDGGGDLGEELLDGVGQVGDGLLGGETPDGDADPRGEGSDAGGESGDEAAAPSEDDSATPAAEDGGATGDGDDGLPDEEVGTLDGLLDAP